jgi:hypothetical protein
VALRETALSYFPKKPRVSRGFFCIDVHLHVIDDGRTTLFSVMDGLRAR